MDNKQRLLHRLDEIASSLEQFGHALALIGLGSVGLELDRLDEYSDIDFFVIVEDGYKQAYLEDLTWMRAVAPVAYCFMNTVDGYKLLFEDGIFCEFAVFELDELQSIPFAPGRIVWKQPYIDSSVAIPKNTIAQSEPKSTEWLVGEALTNLYVGLQRFKRGEMLSGERFIQHFAVDRVLELAEIFDRERSVEGDPFSVERRFEFRHPEVGRYLPQFIQGYKRSPDSAKAILEYLEERFEIDQKMAEAIKKLL